MDEKGRAMAMFIRFRLPGREFLCSSSGSKIFRGRLTKNAEKYRIDTTNA
jgi:hypothetical protein